MKLMMPLSDCEIHSHLKCGDWNIAAALYWITEALPLAVTALLPLSLFPLFGILSAEVVSKNYFNDTLFLLLGSFFVRSLLVPL